MKTNKKPTTIKYQDLTAKLIKGKFGDYMYRSPYYGYKLAHKYNQIIYIYLDDHNGWIDTHCFKNATRLEILDYLEKFKETSRVYNKVSKD